MKKFKLAKSIILSALGCGAIMSALPFVVSCGGESSGSESSHNQAKTNYEFYTCVPALVPLESQYHGNLNLDSSNRFVFSSNYQKNWEGQTEISLKDYFYWPSSDSLIQNVVKDNKLDEWDDVEIHGNKLKDDDEYINESRANIEKQNDFQITAKTNDIHFVSGSGKTGPFEQRDRWVINNVHVKNYFNGPNTLVTTDKNIGTIVIFWCPDSDFFNNKNWASTVSNGGLNPEALKGFYKDFYDRISAEYVFQEKKNF